MKKFLLAAGVMLAVVVPSQSLSLSAARVGSPRPAPQPISQRLQTPSSYARPGCTKLYTVEMARQAAWVVYHKQHITRHDLLYLAHLVKCQRNVGARGYVRWYYSNQAVLRAARLVPWQGPAIASWYDNSGTIGCPGGHQGPYDIATFVVPCGGHVMLKHGDHIITVVRDDSGPYVAGRLFDLGLAAKAALNCTGLCPVYWHR